MMRIYLYLFLFLYFTVAQADTVTYLISLIANQPVTKLPLLYGLLLTGIMALCQYLISRCFPTEDRKNTWGWVATSFLAVTLVSLPIASTLHFLWLGVVALLIGLSFRSWQRRLMRMWGTQRSTWQRLMPATVFCLLLSIYMGIGAAATDLHHFEMRTAQTLQGGDKLRPSRMEENSWTTSQRLFSMRSYAMARGKFFGMGHYLFHQPLPTGKSELLLLPNDQRQRLLFPVDSLYTMLGDKKHPNETALDYFRRMAETERQDKGKATSLTSLPALDYYLSALLLEGDLDLFSREFLRLYPRSLRGKKLPIYYAEALYLYTHTRTNPVVIFHDSTVEANWQDYSTLKASQSDPTIRRNLLRRSYGQTYWWWYEYGRTEEEAK